MSLIVRNMHTRRDFNTLWSYALQLQGIMADIMNCAGKCVFPYVCVFSRAHLYGVRKHLSHVLIQRYRSTSVTWFHPHCSWETLGFSLVDLETWICQMGCI